MHWFGGNKLFQYNSGKLYEKPWESYSYLWPSLFSCIELFIHRCISEVTLPSYSGMHLFSCGWLSCQGLSLIFSLILNLWGFASAVAVTFKAWGLLQELQVGGGIDSLFPNRCLLVTLALQRQRLEYKFVDQGSAGRFCPFGMGCLCRSWGDCSYQYWW